MIVSGILDCFSLKFQFFLNFPSPLILTSQLFIFFFFFFTVLKPYFPLLSIKQLSPRFPPTKRQIFIISYRSFCRMCDRRCKKICIKSEFIDTLASTRTISFSNSSVSIYIYIYCIYDYFHQIKFTLDENVLEINFTRSVWSHSR